MKQALSSWIHLKFWPPEASSDYADRIPQEVKKQIVELSNLYNKEKYTVDSGFELILRAYCGGLPSPSPHRQAFWQILQDELESFYQQQDAA